MGVGACFCLGISYVYRTVAATAQLALFMNSPTKSDNGIQYIDILEYDYFDRFPGGACG